MFWILMLFGVLMVGIVFGAAIFPLKTRWKYLWLLPLLLTAFKYHWLLLIGQYDLPGWLLIIWSIMLEVLAFLTFWLMPGIICLLAIDKKQRQKWHLPVLGAALVLSIIPAAIGSWNGIKAPRIVYRTVPIAGLPKSDRVFKLAVLSDLHSDPFNDAERISRIVAMTNAEHPDATVLLGDLVNSNPERFLGQLEPLRGLAAEYGVFMVPGNHDYYSGWENFRRQMANWRITMLENTGRAVNTPIGKIWFAGITDPAAMRYGLPGPDLPAALVGNTENLPMVLLSHKPLGAYAASARGVVLQLSGHTHGGMMPLLSALVSHGNEGFVSGFYDVNGMTLAVSNGIGIWNGFPFRIGAPPEILILTLVPAEENALP